MAESPTPSDWSVPDTGPLQPTTTDDFIQPNPLRVGFSHATNRPTDQSSPAHHTTLGATVEVPTQPGAEPLSFAGTFDRLQPSDPAPLPAQTPVTRVPRPTAAANLPPPPTASVNQPHHLIESLDGSRFTSMPPLGASQIRAEYPGAANSSSVFNTAPPATTTVATDTTPRNTPAAAAVASNSLHTTTQLPTSFSFLPSAPVERNLPRPPPPGASLQPAAVGADTYHRTTFTVPPPPQPQFYQTSPSTQQWAPPPSFTNPYQTSPPLFSPFQGAPPPPPPRPSPQQMTPAAGGFMETTHRLLSAFSNACATDPSLPSTIAAVAVLGEALGLDGRTVEHLLTNHSYHPRQIHTEMLNKMRRSFPDDLSVRQLLDSYLPTMPSASPPLAPPVTPHPGGRLDLAALSPELRTAIDEFASAAHEYGYDFAEATQVALRGLRNNPTPPSSGGWLGLLNAAAVVVSGEISPTVAWNKAFERLSSRGRGTTSHRRTSPRDEAAAAALAELQYSPPAIRRCLDDPPLGGSSVRSSTSSSSAAAPSAPVPPPPPLLPAPPVPGLSPQPQGVPTAPPWLSAPTTTFDQSFPFQAPNASSSSTVLQAMALNRQRVSNLRQPAWYSPVSGHTSEASIPIPWSELVAQELGAATGVYLPPAPDSDSLASRIGSYNSQRGLFVSDLGRLLLRHALLGSSTPEGVVLNLAVTAARKSHRLSKNGPSLSAAERAGGHKGIELLLYTFDRLLFSEDANAARRLWASPAWADTNLSAIGLLNKLSEDANTCSKSDAEVLARWSGAVSDVFYENNKPVTLSMLYNEFANNIDAYPSSMELLLRLRVHAYGDTPLSEMIGGAAPSQPRRHQPRHHHEAAAAAATQLFSLDDATSRALEQAADRAIAERVRSLDLSSSSASASTSRNRPPASASKPPASGMASNTADTFATHAGGKPVIAGFADIPKIREAGRFPLIPADSDIPPLRSRGR